MNAAQLLRQIREHERQCQWSCDECKAKLARREQAYKDQRETEAIVRGWNNNI